jgi:predicted hotdog family 3-hydroxylacyl-ACP dehydratase
MAVHGALCAGAGAKIARAEAGFLASLRDVRMHVLRLDDMETDLICEAARLAADCGGALYEFTVQCAAQRLLSGRATVVFDAGTRLGKHE